MSRPPEYDNGAYGADAAEGATGEYGGRQVPPNVYLPQSAPPPAYDAYADPAAAHGWENAYDETAELPRIPEDGGGREAGPGRGRHGSRRRARRRSPAWRPGRAAVAAGAVGAVSVAALIAGFSFSDPSSGGARGGQDARTGPTAPDPSTSTSPDPEPSSRPVVADRSADGGGPSGSAPASPSAPAGGAASGPGTQDPGRTATPTSGTTTSAPAPADPTPTTAAPGNSDRKPGHGPGGTKGPK
ncbi:hypothetical protein AB0K80_06285 [Streptomyces sp. NPDC052682]|uniref:hypothetical protein n=1 Tax=Streptomyces sp. NPDC052682 TaxID=3154954 RepID=UPI003418348A